MLNKLIRELLKIEAPEIHIEELKESKLQELKELTKKLNGQSDGE